MKVLEGKLVAGKGKFAIVGARFNEFIVSKLISGAEDTLVRHGVDTDDITLVWVPGAFEIPIAAQKLAQSGKYDAVICLGAVIRGSTSHYELVCSETAKGIAQVGLQTGVPVTFGVITTENIEQAIERAGTKAGNKGADAAMAALELSNLLPRGQRCKSQVHAPTFTGNFMRRTAVRLSCLFRLRRNAAGNSAPSGRFPFARRSANFFPGCSRRAGCPHPAAPSVGGIFSGLLP